MIAQLFSLEIDGFSDRWKVVQVVGQEVLSAPYEFRVEVDPVGEDFSDIDLDALAQKRARLVWDAGDADGAVERAMDGIVYEVSRTWLRLEIVVVPRVALLAETSDYRVFVDKDAVEIATSVLKDHSIELRPAVARVLPKRPQCVQSFESDLDFVSRIFAEEGISWYCAPDARDVVVATDHKRGFTRIEEELPVVDDGGLVAGRSVQSAKIVRRAAVDCATLRDYNFETPAVPYEAEAKDGKGDVELYEFPGMSGMFDDPARGAALAKMRLREKRRGTRVLEGETNARDVGVGAIVKLEGEGATGEWLVITFQHQGMVEGGGRERRGQGVFRYRGSFSAVPANEDYRPARAPAVRVGGVENAVTTGATGDELHTDPYARVRGHLRWDRRGPNDQRASAWMRTVQPPTSGGFMLPRVGWEVLLGFMRGSADAPVVLGRLDNGMAAPAAALPGNKTSSAFGSLSTPGGGSRNALIMDDTAGKEKMSFEASKDWNERIENDRVRSVKANDEDVITGDRDVTIGKVHELVVQGAQTHTVGGSRELNVEADMVVDVETGESIRIGALRAIRVGGDSQTMCTKLSRIVGAAKIEAAVEHQTRVVTGASTMVVGGSWVASAGKHASVQVGGASAEIVGGPKAVKAKKGYILKVKGKLTQRFATRTVKAGGAHDEGYKGKAKYTIKEGAKIKGADVIVVAKDKLVIKAGGLTIEMRPGSVKIKGDFQGSVGAVDEGEEKYG